MYRLHLTRFPEIDPTSHPSYIKIAYQSHRCFVADHWYRGSRNGLCARKRILTWFVVYDITQKKRHFWKNKNEAET